MLTPSIQWKQDWRNLRETDRMDWVSALAGWVDSHSSFKLALRPIIGQVLFQFNRGVFEAGLRSLQPISLVPSAAQRFASCWEQAVLASSMVVPPGSSLGAPSPATTWSVAQTIIDISSVKLAGQSLAMELSTAAYVDSSGNSIVSSALWNAFTRITATVTGVDSKVPPTPLLSPMTPAG